RRDQLRLANRDRIELEAVRAADVDAAARELVVAADLEVECEQMGQRKGLLGLRKCTAMEVVFGAFVADHVEEGLCHLSAVLCSAADFRPPLGSSWRSEYLCGFDTPLIQLIKNRDKTPAFLVRARPARARRMRPDRGSRPDRRSSRRPRAGPLNPW